MNTFTFIRPVQPGDAVHAAVAEPAAAFIAGGTTLVDLMKENVLVPVQLIDINTLPLSKIAVSEKGVSIGALVKNSDLAEHETIRKSYPVLTQALLSGASQQLRNAASVGGNLLQKTRCYYYRDNAMPCNKRKPGSGCPAITGFNRIHAVLGCSDDCIATHPSDMCVALVALDATIDILGNNSERSVPITDFYKLPANTPERETILETGELITSVRLPSLSANTRSSYLKVRDRASYEFALASAGVVLEMQNNTIFSVRIALGGVATIPWRARAAEKVLQGAAPTLENFQKAADAELAPAKSHAFNGFKIELAKRTLVRALQDLSRQL